MNIPQSSTDYIEKIRAKRTKEYDIRVEEYFSDNKKIIEINKYLAVRGIKNTVKKYGLDKEDMSDIVFSYLDSLLECEEELLLIQAKILQASEEQKEDVILGIQREYGLDEEDLEEVLKKIGSLKSTIDLRGEIQNRAQVLLVKGKIRKSLTPEEKEKRAERRMKNTLEKFKNIIGKITKHWHRKTFFMAATASEVELFCEEIQENFHEDIQQIACEVCNKKPWGFDIINDNTARGIFAKIIYKYIKDNDESLEIKLVKSISVAGEIPMYQYQTSVIEKKCPQDVIILLNNYCLGFDSLKRSYDVNKYAKIVQHMKNFWNFIKTEYSKLTFIEIEKIYETLFQSTSWLPDISDNKDVLDLKRNIRGKWIEVVHMMEQKTSNLEEIVAILKRPEIPKDMRSRLAIKDVPGRRKKINSSHPRSQ